MTERLFDADSYIESFEANVLSCEKTDGGYLCVLDRTAFFPEGGGQSSDTGYIGTAFVSHVYEKDGVIYHAADGAVPLGPASCRIDFKERFRKMQNHTGEHIFSGIVHRLFGYSNVGFHLSYEYVRVDFDGILNASDIRRIEEEACRAVTENHPVRAWYPDSSELSSIEYRSKTELCGKIRIVDIEGVDVCACCAPHVRATGEVGVIKAVDFSKYKGGTRIFMVCGSDAVRMFIDEHRALTEAAVSLSLKREEVPLAVTRMKEEIHALKRRIAENAELSMKKALEETDYTEGNLCFFFDGADPQHMRTFANAAVEKCSRIAAVFAKTGEVYKYIIASKSVDLKSLCGEINRAINGKGGGSSVMIQGSCTASRETIEKYFYAGGIFAGGF